MKKKENKSILRVPEKGGLYESCANFFVFLKRIVYLTYLNVLTFSYNLPKNTSACGKIIMKL